MFYSSTSCFRFSAYEQMLIFDAAWGFDIFPLSSYHVEMIQEIHCIIARERNV